MAGILEHRSRACRSALLLVVVLLAACGSGGGGSSGVDDGGGSDSGGTDTGAAVTSSADVCDLLDDAEITSLLGAPLSPEPAGSDSPYPACSWQGGRLIVQVTTGTSVVTAPGQHCPKADIGDEALRCPGSVQFVTSGSRVIVQTIENVTDAQLVAVAEALQPKIEARS